MQDAIAIAVAVAAGIWILRSLGGQFLAPPCGPRSDRPDGADGFVPLDDLRPRK